VRELESFGRLNVVAEFSKRQIDYFHALPPALKGPETTRNGALAMIHYARAERILGDINAATANATEASKLLEQQRTAGDQSEATTIALALGYSTQAVILDNQNDPAGRLRPSAPLSCCDRSRKRPALRWPCAAPTWRCWCGAVTSSSTACRMRTPFRLSSGRWATRRTWVRAI